MLAGDQAAVLAESEESLQELVMRDAKARTDYRLRQNANDKGDGAGEAARCDHNADGEGKGWIGAGRPSEMDVGPGGGGRRPPDRGACEAPATQGRFARGSTPSRVGRERAWHQERSQPASHGGGV